MRPSEITIETIIVTIVAITRKRLLMQNSVLSVGQPKGTESVNEFRDVEIVLKASADRFPKESI